MKSASVLERPATSRSWNPKLAFAVVLALVFLSGAASGALLMDFRVHNRYRPPTFEEAAGKALNFEHMQRELNLTEAQSDQIRSVLSDFWQYYHTVLSDSKQRVEQLLTADQRARFEKMLQEGGRR
jgi:Spy/CpxP family protein refolding chaperone